MKKTTKKISAAALALIMGATAFTGCSGSTNSTPGGTDSAASTSGGATCPHCGGRMVDMLCQE